MITDPLFYLLAIAAVTLLGLSKGGFLGLGVMSLPLMSLFVPPLQAAAIILPTVLAQDVLTVWTFRKDWSAWNLRLMIPSMAAGMAVAGLFAASLTSAHVRLAIGLIAGAFVLRHWLGRRFARLAPSPNAITAILFGIIGGFTTMLANAGGPVWQMHLLPQQLDKLTYVGTFAMLFAASDVFEDPGIRRAWAVDAGKPHHRRASGAGGRHRQLCRDMAGAQNAGRAVFSHRLFFDVRDLGRIDSQCADAIAANVSDVD